jgi:hypothetical protein
MGPKGASEGPRTCTSGAGNAPYAHPLRQPRCEETRAGLARAKPWGCPFFWRLFFGQTKKSRPRCRGGATRNYAFESRPKAARLIYFLDPGIRRGDDNSSVRRPSVCATGLPSPPRALGLGAMFRVSRYSPGLGRPAVERAPSGHRARPQRLYGVGRCVAKTATHRTPTSYYAPSLRSPWRVALDKEFTPASPRSPNWPTGPPARSPRAPRGP